MDIKILGKSYTVRTDVDASFTRETADFVNRRMRELAGKTGTLPTEKIAVLAAMNFAGELLRTRQQLKEQRTVLNQKTKKLLELVDAKL